MWYLVRKRISIKCNIYVNKLRCNMLPMQNVIYNKHYNEI